MITTYGASDDHVKELPMPADLPVTWPTVDRARVAGAAQLTRREYDVLGLVAEGLRYREVAARLFLGHDTVKGHAKTALQKLNARHMAHAVSIAYQIGILPAPDAASFRQQGGSRRG